VLADWTQVVMGSLFWEYRTILVRGLIINFYVFFLAGSLAVGMGLVACLARLSPFRVFRWCGTFYAELFRNTPEYVLLVWVHFVPPLILTLLLRTRINFSPFFSAVIALGLASSGYFTETFRAGIQSIPRGHIEAARSTGISGVLTLRWVILPQAVRKMLPEALNQFISLLKSTTLISLIAVPDLMYQVSMITQEQMRPMPLYSGAAIVYFVIILFLSTLVRRFSEGWRAVGRA
jgi:His/Glu/Gln/Arg/opine family amino acid ABC transporter permease subunit